MPIARVQLPDGRIGKFEVPEGTTPEQIESFVASQMGGGRDQSQMMPSHNQPQRPEGWKQTVSTYAKPVLETVGMLGGGFVGTAAGPVGTVGGAGLGYAAGRQAGKILDNFLIDTPAEQPTQAVINAGGDLATGAAMEMGGQVLGLGIQGLGRFLKPSGVKAAIPGTQANAQRKAAEIFTDAQAAPESAALSSLQAKQAAEAEALMTRKGLDPKLLTPAQRTGSFEAGYLEQGATTANPKFAAQLAERDSTIAAKARGDVTKTFQPSAPLTAKSAQETGENIVSGLEKARVPVKEAENAAWSKIPDYQMPTTNTDEAIKTILKEPMPADVLGAVTNITNFINGVKGHHGSTQGIAKTVQGLRSAEVTINGAISKAAKAGDSNIMRQLYRIKEAIRTDFDALSEAAGTGRLFEYRGKLVNPDLVTKELQAAQTEAAGISSNYVYPAKARELDAINKRIATNQEILSGMKPADDVSAQINAAKKATIERVERFDKGATKGILAKGDEISGLRTTYESIPAKYFSEAGANDLIRAVGQEQAKGLMTEHVTASLEKLSKNGVLNVPAAMQFLQKNAPTLNKLKLTDTAKKTISEQIPGAIRAKLDARMAVDNLGNEVNTLHEVRKIIAEFSPAIRATYQGGGVKELVALKDYHKILEILGRNKNVSYAKGSNSIDKLMGAAQSAPQGSLGYKLVSSLAEAITGAGAGFAVAGPVGGLAGATIGAGAKATRTVITEHQKAAIKSILEDGITNPETAQLLTRIAKGYKPKPVEMNKILGKNGYEWTASGLATKAALPIMDTDE